MILGISLLCDYGYSFKNADDILQINNEYASNDCAFIFDDGFWKADRHYAELTNYTSTTFVSTEEIRRLKQTEAGKEKCFVTYISLNNGTGNLPDEIVKLCPNVNKNKKLYTWKYTDIYYFYNAK